MRTHKTTIIKTKSGTGLEVVTSLNPISWEKFVKESTPMLKEMGKSMK